MKITLCFEWKHTYQIETSPVKYPILYFGYMNDFFLVLFFSLMSECLVLSSSHIFSTVFYFIKEVVSLCLLSVTFILNNRQVKYSVLNRMDL